MAQPIQQDDNYKQFMSWITSGGLRYACAQHNGMNGGYQTKVPEKQSYHVVVVGAGMAGLSAAYELAQIGHKVTVLELQTRVGGRVKTLREPQFHPGLHVEAGAMRLPPNHYLTHHYLNLFDIPTRPFQNYQQNGFMYLFGQKIRMKEFKKNNGKYSNKFWKGWDANISEDVKRKLNIKGILDYFEKTLAPVKADLGTDPSAEDWQVWIAKWSVLSVEDFLRGTRFQSADEPQLRPWPESAINGYKSFTETATLSFDITSFLREDLGQWWSADLCTPVDGMDALPKAFIKPNAAGWNSDVNLSKNIRYGCRVEKVTIGGKKHPVLGTQPVHVFSYNTVTNEQEVYDADAVFLTTSLPILREMDLPLNLDQQKALANIDYAASTKVMLQCRTRFWQKSVGQGGFSKSNNLFAQLHYPDYDGSGIADDERGILMVYTWCGNALTFGAQDDQQVIRECVQEIAKFHPEIVDEFEVGQVQAWSRDPATQAAFATMTPYEYLTSMKSLKRPTPPIYLAGEAISWSNGWIQGALYSGLLQAFLFQSCVEGYSCVDPFTIGHK